MARRPMQYDLAMVQPILIEDGAEAYAVINTQVGGVIRGYRRKRTAEEILLEFKSRYKGAAKAVVIELKEIKYSEDYITVDLSLVAAERDLARRFFDENYPHLRRKYSDGVVKRKFE